MLNVFSICQNLNKFLMKILTPKLIQNFILRTFQTLVKFFDVVLQANPELESFVADVAAILPGTGFRNRIPGPGFIRTVPDQFILNLASRWHRVQFFDLFR